MQAYSDPKRATEPGATNSEAIQKSDVPQYLDNDRTTINLPNGWTAEVRVEYDDGMSEPWKEHDGHGPVSEWRKLESKRPGEVILTADRGRALFYNFAEAVKIARRDGWDAPPYDVTATKGQRAHHAATADFVYLKRWCAGDWQWIIVAVTVRDAAGEMVERDSLGGVEGDGDYWRDCAAEMINGIISGVLIPAHDGNPASAPCDTSETGEVRS